MNIHFPESTQFANLHADWIIQRAKLVIMSRTNNCYGSRYHTDPFTVQNMSLANPYTDTSNPLHDYIHYLPFEYKSNHTSLSGELIHSFRYHKYKTLVDIYNKSFGFDYHNSKHNDYGNSILTPWTLLRPYSDYISLYSTQNSSTSRSTSIYIDIDFSSEGIPIASPNLFYNYIIGDFRNKHVNTSLFLETFSLIDKNIFLEDEPRFFIFLFNLKYCDICFLLFWAVINGRLEKFLLLATSYPSEKERIVELSFYRGGEFKKFKYNRLRAS